MTSVLPDGLDDTVRDLAVTSGRTQLRLELDNVKRILEQPR